MAYEAGTSTGINDLLDKLKTFLTNHVDLPVIQRWVVLDDRVESGDRVIYFRGPGQAGTDLIYANIRARIDLSSSTYYLEWRAPTGFVSASSFEGQPGGPPHSVYTPMNDLGNAYWFFANGRRFMLFAQLSSSVLMSVYAGFILPYALPSEYPYPMAIIANTHSDSIAWDTSTTEVSSFFHNATGDNSPLLGCGYLRDPGGSWLPFARLFLSDTPVVHTWPYDNTIYLLSRQPYGGSEALISIIVYNYGVGEGVYGELDGVFFISGDQISFLDTITVGADVYLVMIGPHTAGQNQTAAVFRG